MQSRRDFLKALGALGALAAFPNYLSSPITSPPKFLGCVHYSLGFSISQELIDDDLYGDLYGLGGMAALIADGIDSQYAKEIADNLGPRRLLSS